MSNQRDLGVGIVLDSNLFNLAALLGLGAVVAGQVRARSASTIFNGAIAALVTIISGSLIIGFFSQVTSTVLMLLVIIPYIYILVVGPDGVKGLPIPDSWKHFLALARKEVKEETGEIGEEIQQHERRKRESQGDVHKQSWKPALWVAPAIAAIVLGSIGLVKSATALGQGWLPDAVLGTFILGCRRIASSLH